MKNNFLLERTAQKIVGFIYCDHSPSRSRFLSWSDFFYCPFDRPALFGSIEYTTCSRRSLDWGRFCEFRQSTSRDNCHAMGVPSRHGRESCKRPFLGRSTLLTGMPHCRLLINVSSHHTPSMYEIPEVLKGVDWSTAAIRIWNQFKFYISKSLNLAWAWHGHPFHALNLPPATFGIPLRIFNGMDSVGPWNIHLTSTRGLRSRGGSKSHTFAMRGGK